MPILTIGQLFILAMLSVPVNPCDGPGATYDVREIAASTSLDGPACYPI